VNAEPQQLPRSLRTERVLDAHSRPTFGLSMKQLT
jgi:hypothetical protein